ncbi:FecR family protein [Pedobacter sp. PWIIR3]
MLEKEFYVARLIAAKINGAISDKEQAELDGWLNSSASNQERYETYLNEQELDKKLRSYHQVDSAALFEKVESGIRSKPVRNKRINLWTKIGVAAAISTLIISAGLWFNGRKAGGENINEIQYSSDVNPGVKGATLTLANGKKINLTTGANGELAKEAGVSISKTANGKLIYKIIGTADDEGMNTLSTANGETYEVILPDGSNVWLNSASSLTYKASLLEKGKRKVALTGEGYFEIAKDKVHPFIVSSGNQQVEVLGTHFNVNAYHDEKVFRTTLLEGSVKLTDNGMESILVPGIQAVNSNGQINQIKVDTELAIAWKNNKFIFDRVPIEEIMRMIARWYNLKVVYEGEIPSGTFWGSVSRFENVSKALIPLEATGNVHFKIEGRTIFVAK